MRCLIIGGGRFLGAKVVEELAYAKHDVAFFDPSPPPASVADHVRHIPGEKGSLESFKEDFASFKPDVVAHLSALTADEGSAFVATFSEMASHLVVTSNTNVYRAHGRFRQTEPGPSLAVPIAEGAPLREKSLREEDQGDKRDVEIAITRSKLPSTVLRLAPLYGPHDYFRRFYPLMVRMIDARPHILLGARQADWRWSHAHVDDAAQAVALAIAKPSSNYRVYNVGELKTPTVKERVEHIGTVFGWEGKVIAIADSKLPEYLQVAGDFDQDLEIDSSLIRRDLGFKEKSDYYEGLSTAVDWYRAHPPPKLKGQKFNYEVEDALVSDSYH